AIAIDLLIGSVPLLHTYLRIPLRPPAVSAHPLLPETLRNAQPANIPARGRPTRPDRCPYPRNTRGLRDRRTPPPFAADRRRSDITLLGMHIAARSPGSSNAADWQSGRKEPGIMSYAHHLHHNLVVS